MFSIVIPLYNKEHTIARTLTSVVAQTYTEFEVVIVNDGSTDNGVEVVNDFTSDSRVRIINQNNQGVSSARNKGVASAKYNYIAFLDGDDEWLPGYLEKMKEAIELYPKCGMYCCAGMYKENVDEVISFRLAKKYKDKITIVNYFENPHVFSHTSATIVYKEEFIKCGGFPYGMSKNQDFALFYLLALSAPVVYCGFALSCYYGNVAGQTTSSNRGYIHTIERINITYNAWNKSGRTNKLFRIFLKYELRHIFISALRANNYEFIDLLLNNLDQGILRLFFGYEIGLMNNRYFNKLLILHILITKVIWRMHGYPRTGAS